MDLNLIAGDFLYDDNVPKNQRWLLKYFNLAAQVRFLNYYVIFKDLKVRSANHLYNNFVHHTGIHYTLRGFQKSVKKFNDLQALEKKAIDEFDFIALEQLRSGKYSFTHGYKN